MATAPTIRIHVIREDERRASAVLGYREGESAAVAQIANALTECEPLIATARIVIDRLRAMPEAAAHAKADEIERRFSPALERAAADKAAREQEIEYRYAAARSSRGVWGSDRVLGPALALGEAAHRQALEDAGYGEYSFADVARRSGVHFGGYRYTADELAAAGATIPALPDGDYTVTPWSVSDQERREAAQAIDAGSIAAALFGGMSLARFNRYQHFIYDEIGADAPVAAPAQCPDCKGSRVYEGLFSRGPCLTCSGGAA